MKYVIFAIGLAIIVLRTIGINIDILSIGLFLIISIIALLNNLDSLSEFSGFGIKIKINQGLKSLSDKIDKVESKLMETDKKEEGIGKIPEDHEKDKEFLNMTGGDFEEFQEHFKPDFNSPKLALIETAIEIEKVLKSISKRKLEKDNKYPISPRIIVDQLYRNEIIDNDFSETFSDFWKLRNELVHGVDKVYSDNQIISLVESGLRILNVLKSIENNLSKGLKIFIMS